MQALTLINPDDFLGNPRVWTAERNQQAWERCYEIIEGGLVEGRGEATLYIVCGLQGSGKSRWVSEHPEAFLKPAIVLDAALPAARHRERALVLAQKYRSDVRVIWINTPLETALAWNRLRPADQQVPDEAIRSVHALFEAPSTAEGFSHVEIVRPDMVTQTK